MSWQGLLTGTIDYETQHGRYFEAAEKRHINNLGKYPASVWKAVRKIPDVELLAQCLKDSGLSKVQFANEVLLMSRERMREALAGEVLSIYKRRKMELLRCESLLKQRKAK